MTNDKFTLRIKEQSNNLDLTYKVVVRAIKLFWKFLGIRFRFYGLNNLPSKGGAVIASNHIGYLDFAFIGTAALKSANRHADNSLETSNSHGTNNSGKVSNSHDTNYSLDSNNSGKVSNSHDTNTSPDTSKKITRSRLIRFMAKKSIFDHKIAGPLMRGMKHIAVDRDNGSSSFVAAMRALRKGELVGIFPEATISTSFEVKEMKTGAVRLAMGAGVPVIPTAVWGSQRIMTKGRKPNFKPARTPILVAFGQPIYFSKDEDVAAADERLRQEVISLVEKIRQHYPDSPKGQWWAPQSQGGTAPALKP